VAREPREAAQRVDEHFRRLVPFGFSGAVLVARDGQVLLSRGYGMADREAGIPVSAETAFDIGSITKQFTAAAILKLEMEGKLNVAEPVSRWFPGVPADRQAMTLHHLLTHSSGLRDGFGGDEEVATRDSLAGVILNSELLWAPGTRYQYSNAGYTLLAAIVEKASGMPYERYMRERLFAPAGMSRTGYVGVQWRPGELAAGYRGGQRRGLPTEQNWAADGPYWNLRGNGGILSTLPDLFRWHQALEGETILSAEAKRKMWTPHVAEGPEGQSHYGYGWAIMKTNRGTPLITHNGGNGIFFADFRRYVDEGVVVLVASNTTDAPAEYALTPMLRLLFGGDYTAPPAAVSGDPARAAALAGTYRLPGGGTVTVTADGTTLRLSPAGQEAFAWVRGGSSDARLDTLNARAVEIMEAGERGDFSLLHAALGQGGPPPEEAAQMHREFTARMSERHGAFRSVEAVGSSARGPRSATTLVRMRYERGTQLVRIAWAGGSIDGIAPVRVEPVHDFLPVSATEWASYDMPTNTGVRLRADGTALVVETSAGPVRAKRIPG
jgi:CubicO group peptidase (beta-lactamase class C family)